MVVAHVFKEEKRRKIKIDFENIFVRINSLFNSAGDQFK